MMKLLLSIRSPLTYNHRLYLRRVFRDMVGLEAPRTARRQVR